MHKIISIIEFVIGLSAVIGGYGLISSNGAGMPVSWLTNSLFGSYLIPGIILMCVVGGTYITASVVTWKKCKFTPELTAIAGFGLLIWIFTQIYIIKVTSLLQVIYFAVGLVTLITVLLNLRYGKYSRL